MPGEPSFTTWSLDIDATDEEILALASAWIALLVEHRYDDALATIGAREHWTPELLATAIRNYGAIDPMADGSIYAVTPLANAVGGLTPRHEVSRYEASAGARVGDVWFDVPLNGAWSDLTITFDLEMRDDRLYLALDDVHVH